MSDRDASRVLREVVLQLVHHVHEGRRGQGGGLLKRLGADHDVQQAVEHVQTLCATLTAHAADRFEEQRGDAEDHGIAESGLAGHRLQDDGQFLDLLPNLLLHDVLRVFGTAVGNAALRAHMTKKVAIRLACELADERRLVAEQRTIVLADDADVVPDVRSVQVAEHQNQRLEHRGSGLGVFLIHEGQESGKQLVVVLDELSSSDEREEESKPHVARENGNQLQDGVNCQRIWNGQVVYDNIDDGREVVEQHLGTLHLVEHLQVKTRGKRNTSLKKKTKSSQTSKLFRMLVNSSRKCVELSAIYSLE